MTLSSTDLIRLRDLMRDLGFSDDFLVALAPRNEVITILHRYSAKADLQPLCDALNGAGWTAGMTMNPDDYSEFMLNITPPAPTHSTAQVDSIMRCTPGCGC